MPPRVEVCKVGDVAPGEVRKVEVGGLVLAVYNLDGEFYATDDACTHGPGSLSEGFVDGCHIECNFHQGVFDIRTGAVVQPPCIVPIKTYRTIVEQGTVYVEP
jgi:nitrite reductase/ring-hydroxylating ferredoxin subunit